MTSQTPKMPISITIQTTGDCNLACTYCYQHCKNTKAIDMAHAKKFIDAIIHNDQEFWQGYTDFADCGNIILSFIGGEPLMNYRAVIECCDYYAEQCKKYDKVDLYNKTIFDIGTNGTIINKEITDLIDRHKSRMNLSITIDGCEELHDACRRFKNTNAPSYQLIVKNMEEFKKHLCPMRPLDNTKITLAPENIDYLVQSTKNMFETLGFNKVPANCVFEKVWSFPDSIKLYKYLKEIADYFLEKDWDFDSFDYSGEQGHTPGKQFGFFCAEHFVPETDMQNSWCGGNGRMLFLQYDGKIYNCVRYSETSMGNPDRDLYIGHVDTGINMKDNIAFLRSASNETIMDDECKSCAVAKGCADCLAYNYEISGTFKKPKALCDMHKARSLANVYFWNKYYIKKGIDKFFFLHLPLSEAIKYVDEQELEMLLDLSNRRYIKYLQER